MSKWTIRGLIFTALFAAVLIVLSFMKVSLFFTPVPITLATLGVMLTGSFLGARYGAMSVLLVLLIALVGFPVVGGGGGMALYTGPTAGYVIAWPFAAFFIGWFAQRMEPGRASLVKLTVVNFLFGSLLLYPTGASWMAHVLHSTSAVDVLLDGVLPFLPGDFLKALVCAFVVTAVWRVYPMKRIVG
ncbi:MAG TPA: biotin transporter BioY [Bacilli bacterium]|nr:biotin transporter BioY [Bacilli bacterium]